MCTEIYLGSNNKLPLVPWNKEKPGFTLSESEQKGVKEILQSNYLYSISSFMGCSCGFVYGDDSDHLDQRIKNVKDCLAYLAEQKESNTLKLFCASWEEFPETYEEKVFEFDSFSEREFEFEEDKVLIIQ